MGQNDKAQADLAMVAQLSARSRQPNTARPLCEADLTEICSSSPAPLPALCSSAVCIREVAWISSAVPNTSVAVYLFVTVAAIALLLIGLYYTRDPLWQSVWINLATGLLGVTLLFFLVDRFFLADEWGLTDRIDQLVRPAGIGTAAVGPRLLCQQPRL